MSHAESSLNTTARRIAQFPAAATSGSPQDTVDLSTDIVNLIQARNDFAVNVKALQTGDELTKTLLNMLG